MTLLVAVCGLDGAGKSSQVNLLAAGLRQAGVTAVTYPNPTLAPLRRAWSRVAHARGAATHLELLGPGPYRRIAASLKLLHWEQVSRSLETTAADVVVVDRYTYCQYAAAEAQDAPEVVEELRLLYAPLPVPDLLVYLDVSPQECALRVARRGVDEESLTFLENFRAAYRRLPEWPRFCLVDGEARVSEVADRMVATVTAALQERRAATLTGGN